jgi:GTP-binding protein HflX
LLVHVVDASNPNVLAQIESVDKILHELKLNEIPSVIVLNKADLLEKDEIEALKRQISLDKDSDCVAISAIRPKTLEPLLEKIERFATASDLHFAVNR